MSVSTILQILVMQAVLWWISVEPALPVVKEVVTGTIFRKSNYLTVDQYTVNIAASSAILEVDLLSMETTNNVTFLDVNSDCDSAYIDPQVYLFQQLSSGSLSFIASNDDAGDDNPAYFSRGRTDGSVSASDSYLIRQLNKGTYVLAVGRYPLSRAAAISGRSTDSVNAFSPYFCMARKASYGNYKMTVRVQSSSSNGVITKRANSYVGNSCNVSPTVTTECVYALPADIGGDILKTCSYDKTIY
ncbi:uncharacterized protein PHALS_00576 [Plasmopara halstedii]|uniref:RxLR-like protein n=1 Tax=Plasmopara halstedii TaxID=4781 RepID=A0A0P1ARQ9_PLAHL|nr:uncharacterized protein PHALS_00576 [Plasmopara halstedii]CEG44289.1 hypothetical protein PHALS_00576 [Plasmopara halstedii]|eukprot:XP_024580658.1 hypothetical protein PHALS_00576 [Plasmopara halstedii]